MTTRDALFDGRVTFEQPARGEGYRANVDALLLAWFAREGGGPRVHAYDLGAGAGAVALALLHWGAAARVTLVESDALAAGCARVNLATNGWAERGEVVETDVTHAAKGREGTARLVVCNPPYFAPGGGRRAKGEARARARSGDLDAFVRTARALLGVRGRAAFVYPARELARLLGSLRAVGLEPKRARAVHASVEHEARVILVEAMPAKNGGLVLEPPLVERDGAGYTPVLARIVAGD